MQFYAWLIIPLILAYEGAYVADESHGDREDANVFMFYGKFDALTKRHLPTK